MSSQIFRVKYKIDEPGTISHITQRAPGRELLFLEKGDYLYMIHLIKDTISKFLLDLFAFVLMPNHIHLLLKQSRKNLSIAMKNLFERYAEFFNIKYKRKGHVFCGRFRQTVCLEENYLFASSVYIHINPVRAGLVDDPLNYPWSSINSYLLPIDNDIFVNYKYVLNMLNSKIEKAREIYKGLLMEAKGVKTKDILEDSKAMSLFTIKLNTIINTNFINEIENQNIFDIDLYKKIECLKEMNKFKNPQTIKARKYMIQQLLARGFSYKEIAEKLNLSERTILRYCKIVTKKDCPF